MNISEEQIEEIKRKALEGIHMIPEHMHDGIISYLTQGRPQGSFLTAVLSNDLIDAFVRADHINSANMFNWVKYLYNYAPPSSYGSPEKVKDWLARFVSKAE